MRLPFMGPSRDEVVAHATDLIARFGAHARDEAQHLEEVASRLNYPRNCELYRRVAREIEKQLATSRQRTDPTTAAEIAK